MFHDLKVGNPLASDGLLVGFPLCVRHPQSQGQRLQARIAREGALHEGAECLPAHLRSTGIETLEGMEHIHVVVEAHPYGMRQALRLPLKEEAQARPFLGVRIPEDDEDERQGSHQRQAH